MSSATLLQLQARRRYGTLSPLRYPGGKASLAGFFADLIEKLGLEDPTYVEPYAGGAGAGVALLLEGIVSKLVINDRDPAVFAFWHSAVNQNDAMCKLVADTPLAVDEWRRQKEIYRAGDTEDQLALGFAFFYLNRTNRSGILNAGPIGGVNQDGNYKIDARYNRETLVGRLSALERHASDISVSMNDGAQVVAEYGGERNSFLYIDPPYVQAGSSLYLNAFGPEDHKRLAQAVLKHATGNWLITYDDTEQIRDLYSSQTLHTYDLYYSAHKAAKSNELAILSPSVAKLVDMRPPQ